MSEPAPQGTRQNAVVIWIALVMGVSIFFALSFVLQLSSHFDPALTRGLLIASGALTVVCVPLSRLLPKRITIHAMTRHILGVALCEAPCLFALVGYLITKDALFLAVFAVAFGAMLTLFPTETRWTDLQS